MPIHPKTAITVTTQTSMPKPPPTRTPIETSRIFMTRLLASPRVQPNAHGVHCLHQFRHVQNQDHFAFSGDGGSRDSRNFPEQIAKRLDHHLDRKSVV